MSAPLLLELAVRFGGMAFLAIGGANAVVPEMQRQVVEVEHWMSGPDFAALFAIANVAPGPNVLIVTLIGWKVAGLAGALVATVSFIAPTSLFAALAFTAWNRLERATWRAPVQLGLGAVTVALVAATGWLLAATADTGVLTAALTVASAVGGWRTSLNPIWFFAVGAALGAAFL